MLSRSRVSSLIILPPDGTEENRSGNPGSEPLPLEPAVFEAIHRLNSRFERILHDFRGLQPFPYFPHHKLTAWQNVLGLIQAEANFALSAAIHQRAETNALYLDRLSARRERELTDPDDVLLEAEYRRQESARSRETRRGGTSSKQTGSGRLDLLEPEQLRGYSANLECPFYSNRPLQSPSFLG